MMLSLKQLKDVCLVNNNTYRRCRYLCQDDIDPQKFYCMKMSAKAKSIDHEIQSYVDLMKLKGKDPTRDNLPLGDNCQGYPLLRHLEQGYDVKD
jgi:hypothetical protein